MISWKVNKLISTTIDDLQRVIIGCEYECSYKTDSVFRRNIGKLNFEHSHLDGENFISYHEVTHEDVIGWIKSQLNPLDLEEIESIQDDGTNVTEEDLTDSDTDWPYMWNGDPRQYDEWGNEIPV